MREVVRGYAGDDVGVDAEAIGDVGRYAGLLRARIHAEQREVCAERRSDERSAARSRSGNRRAPGERGADGTDDDWIGASDESVLPTG